MRVVFTSNLYLPIMGGSVMVLDRWSRALVELGHQVVILTKTAGGGFQNTAEWKESQNPLRVCRFHTFRESVEVLRWADRVVMIEMSLNWFLAILAAGKRPLVTHHTHLTPLDGKMRPYRWLQYAAGLCIPSVACSAMIARQWGKHVGVAPNPYDEKVFRPLDLERDIDFLFAGRFGPEKGVMLFVKALHQIRGRLNGQHGRRLRVVFAGKGSEEAQLREELSEMKDDLELVYLGPASPEELATWYNRTLVVVIPSVWQEPFGLIGVEALACGCRIICSDQPGLKEATAGMATYVKTGDIDALADALLRGPESSDHSEMDQEVVSRFLKRHQLQASAEHLLECTTQYRNRISESISE